MMLCERCRVQPATTNIAGIAVCIPCAHQAAASMGKHFVGQGLSENQQASLSDIGPEGVIVPPVGVIEGLKPSSPSSGSTSPSLSDSAHKAATAVSNTADSLKTLAWVLGIGSAAAVLWMVHRAYRAQTHAVQFAASHPEVVRAALL